MSWVSFYGTKCLGKNSLSLAAQSSASFGVNRIIQLILFQGPWLCWWGGGGALNPSPCAQPHNKPHDPKKVSALPRKRYHKSQLNVKKSLFLTQFSRNISPTLGLLLFHIQFRISVSSSMETVGILAGVALLPVFAAN